ncbi:hypothetical protein A1O3_00262 [Capronia epimyces CBS 606.96]|uniref:3-oxoacyl-[acyl-carrier protein] reductase n=1 Tax=Capronia epimyces CBS 606.96 TaxID=1182542 RepID=W9YFP1_9EURO|nr:uncharacterized protein A1O3_00262 [Capronia epimyces CBS 606.96]EXJ91712.1 hypothetical protein A1O3_00262 [Capronia epimyces CBS 606.96]
MISSQEGLSGVALITGAGSGIGKGTAFSFASAGCQRLFLGDVNLPGLEKTEAELKAEFPAVDVRIHKVDISYEHSVDAFVDAAVAAFGRVDYACNIAGWAPQREPIAEVPVATYDRVVNIDEYGTWLCHRAEIRQMVKQTPLPGAGSVRGSIVSVASLSGINASPGMSTYCAAKFGTVAICKSDALDYGPQGIRVNVVCPGLTDTPLYWWNTPDTFTEMMIGRTPLRRLGTVDDLGKAILWLSSPNAAFVTGVVVPVDGGLVLQRRGM